MLLFESSVGEGEGARRNEIRYDLPDGLEVALDLGVEHDLILGIALQVAGRSYNWTSDTWDELILEGEGMTLDAVIRGHRREELRVRFER